MEPGHITATILSFIENMYNIHPTIGCVVNLATCKVVMVTVCVNITLNHLNEKLVGVF